jgi:hypothetical protein
VKIERHDWPRATIEEFAEANDLVMEIHERHPDASAAKFYAHFKNTDIKEGTMLRGGGGDGPTPEAAIHAYAREISTRLLVVNAFRPDRREILVPILTPGPLTKPPA